MINALNDWYWSGFVQHYHCIIIMSSLFCHSVMRRFKYKTVSSGEFRDCFVQFMESEGLHPLGSDNGTFIDSINWDELFHSPGMPRHTAPDFSNRFLTEAQELAQGWISFASTSTSTLAAGSSSGDNVPYSGNLKEVRGGRVD
jgi:hypothetical protein